MAPRHGKESQVRPAPAKGRSVYPVLGPGARLWSRGAAHPRLLEKGLQERILGRTRRLRLLQSFHRRSL